MRTLDYYTPCTIRMNQAAIEASGMAEPGRSGIWMMSVTTNQWQFGMLGVAVVDKGKLGEAGRDEIFVLTGRKEMPIPDELRPILEQLVGYKLPPDAVLLVDRTEEPISDEARKVLEKVLGRELPPGTVSLAHRRGPVQYGDIVGIYSSARRVWVRGYEGATDTLKYSHDFGNDEQWAIISLDEPDLGVDLQKLKVTGPVDTDKQVALRWMGTDGDNAKFLSWSPNGLYGFDLRQHVKGDEKWCILPFGQQGSTI